MSFRFLYLSSIYSRNRALSLSVTLTHLSKTQTKTKLWERNSDRIYIIFGTCSKIVSLKYVLYNKLMFLYLFESSSTTCKIQCFILCCTFFSLQYFFIFWPNLLVSSDHFQQVFSLPWNPLILKNFLISLSFFYSEW